MNLQTYQFPKATAADMVFPTFDTIPALLEKAKERGFYNGNTPSNKLFSDWFYTGLDKMPEIKAGVDKEAATKALAYARVLMGSFAPKHEHKEAVCAMIFAEFLELSPKEIKK